MLGMKGRRYKLWWSGKGDGVGGVGVIVKEELCKKELEVRRLSDSDDCCCPRIGCLEDDYWVCSPKWKKFERKTVSS